MRPYHLFTLLVLISAAVAQPYQPQAIWQREGAGDSSLYGSEILALGDQNDDGLNDWAVYASGLGYAPAGHPNEPKVEFFRGGNPPDTEPYLIRVADRSTEISVRGARALGDLNGDGYVDWYIFTSYIDDPEQRHIYKIYLGGPGVHEVPDLVLDVLWCDPIGDFNGDGFDDIYLSTHTILYGGDPMDTIPDWGRNSSLGYVCGGGDVNHDGSADFISWTDANYLDLYLGGIAPDTMPEYHWPNMPYIPTIVRDMNGDLFDDLCLARRGWGELLLGGGTIDTIEDASFAFPCSGSGPLSMVSGGDFNHDGFGDVVMLRPWCENRYFGVLTLHLGGWWINPQPAFVLYGWTEPLNLIHFQTAVGLGDINGDLIDDFAVGACGGLEYAAQRGKAVVFAGDSSLHTGIANRSSALPNVFSLSVYPNPFNSTTTIRLTSPVMNQPVTLTIINVLGQTMMREELPPIAGEIIYRLDAADWATGLYIGHVESGDHHAITKLMVLK